MGKVSKVGGGPIGGESWIVPSGMVLKLPDGLVGTPSLAFTSDTNTGLYRIGSDNVGVSVGGTLRFDVSTTAVTSTLAIVHPVGAVGTPSVTFTGDTTSGLYRIGASNIGVALNGALEYDFSATVLNLKGNTLSGDSASGGILTLASTSHSTKGTISVGRLTLSDLANSDGIVFGSLGTATKGIDLSGSGLSGTDSQIYLGTNNYWTAAGYLYSSRVYTTEIHNTDGTSYISLAATKFEFVNPEMIGTHIFANVGVTLFGNIAEPVCTLTSVTVSGSDLQHADIDTGTAVGDLVHLRSGTDATKGTYRITVVGVNSVTVDRAPGGAGTNIALTVYKDVISFHPTDATNGQMITSWSAQNKPMQLGGTVLAATANSLTSTDVVMGGMTEFMGDTYLKAGTSTGYAKQIGSININTTAVGNVDAGEDTLMTYSLPANALSATAKAIRVTVYGTTTNNANAKTVKVYFGTTVVYSGAMTANQAYNWTAQYTAIKTGASTQDVFGTGLVENSAFKVVPYYATDTQTDTNAIVIKCTGEATTTNDIIQQGMLVEYIS